ncbi:MAG TPA: hypothetical protein VK672_06105 [Solirubrobacteraceae bacterium]|jgi:hypothetical protein|nr:hypothetical protein [Solirubrobacteraceae bacterium]
MAAHGSPTLTRVRAWVVLAAAIPLCALGVSSCGDTLQDQPIGPAALETVLVKSDFPTYWLGLEYRGMRITSVTIDPAEAVTIRYGDCVLGGQYTCVTPVAVVSSPDNSFIPGAGPGTPTTAIRGARASVAQGGTTLAIPTAGVVVSVYARTPSLAREAASMMAPLNEVGLPRAPLPAALPDTGLARMPLPSQVPAGVNLPRPHSE